MLAFYSAIEFLLFSLFRKMVIVAFDLNKKKSLGPGTRFREKTMICFSKARPFGKSHHFVCVVYARARELTLTTRTSCAVGTSNEI